MKSYVNMNAEKRAETTNKFDADFHKLSVNSLFGKMIENPEKHTKVNLFTPRVNWRNGWGITPSSGQKLSIEIW